MLLLLFNRVQVGAPAVGSTGYGVLCLETTIFSDELEASVLIGELEASIADVTVSTTIHETVLTSTYTC